MQVLVKIFLVFKTSLLNSETPNTAQHIQCLNVQSCTVFPFEIGNISWLRNILMVDPYPSLPLSGSIWRNSHGVGVKQGNGDITF